ncbi:MAG TPA: FkbM family methyltransferase, partial [Candidatus Binatia bacterium]|nr:FkbM family methyltransferase [Candidatus Binatia bacterium]
MKNLLNFAAAELLEASAEFKIGVRSVPILKDHGFQSMVVLPGSLYIYMALSLDRELSWRVPCVVRNVVFQNPVILSTEDAAIKVELSDRSDGSVEYTFYEAGVEASETRIAERFAAKLQIDRHVSPSARPGMDALSVKVFQAQTDAVIKSDEFYAKLRENGNHYGPSFQRLSSIWRAGNQSLGKICLGRQNSEIGTQSLDPSLLDSMAQLLASFVLDNGKTFILRSIEKLEILNTHFPDTLWGHAVLCEQNDRDQEGFVGDVQIFDDSGQMYVKLSKVGFTFLDNAEGAQETPPTKFAIASNFSAEPMEDSFRFWGDYFGVHMAVEFAPYNQVFQQLLDTGSSFRRNGDGVNIILLSLEEWAVGNRRMHMTLSKEAADKFFGCRTRCVLPGGLEIVHLNQYETDYLYKEIFADQCYLRHGIQLRDGDTVLDIGANIGLFSLFVMSRCKNPRIYAFEPAPEAYELLRANCNAYGSSVQTTNVGISDRTKTATFTFYEKSSVFSSFHSDESEDRHAIQTVVRNMLKSESTVGGTVEEYIDELTNDRLHQKKYECQLISISDIIRDNQIDRINLLKIDAEKSELDIIQGINESDWSKIDQVVIEVHDRTGEVVQRITKLLNEKGYRCAVEHEKLLEDSGLFNLYAIRGERTDEVRTDEVRSVSRTDSLRSNVQDFCAALQSFMTQSTAPLILCLCPRTPAAETDAELTAALNSAEEALLTETSKIPNVHTITSTALLAQYPVKNHYDEQSHRVGHIPYTQECYAAIGTALIRTMFSCNGNPFKVIALDCDNTLWKGVCGEDGTAGIEITPPYRALQEFMVRQMNAGMLLCVCSKNNERDALDVFDQRADMLLKRDHLASWRLNWNSKSSNIKSLANELNLGLDSFIFIDDNPVDCADVRANCPEVLTLQLPPNPESFPSFLNHIWAFDRRGSTDEDRNRTRMYQQNRRREEYRQQTFSLKDFVKGLGLRVEVTEATEDQLGRVSQLT